ncbi:MAG: methionyl-tRNA formyltransferase [Bacteroidales bacterium]|nr:methionyl-tRNA formyltransferase [Bacteroidales bacterium]
MRIVFMGTPDFAAEILKAIVEDKQHEVVSVVTSMDKAAGRGMKIQVSPVKTYAQEQNLYILQPEKLKDAEFVKTLSLLKADIFVVVAFRMLPEVVWQIPPKGTVNLHASLLPHYRGAAPINWAIINGETQTGVTTFFINEKIDEGNILLAETTDISDKDNAETLHNKLLNMGKIILLKTLKAIENGSCKEQKQPLCSDLKLAPKLFKENTFIDWNWSACRIYNFVRGLSPYPVAFSRYKNSDKEEMLIKIFSCEPETTLHHLPCGKIQTDNKTFLKVACSDGYIYINELQIFGKKRMSVHDFLLGNKWLDEVELF